MKGLVVVVVWWLVVVALVPTVVLAHQCTYNSTHGFLYDLTAMRSIGDLTLDNQASSLKYYFQVCSGVVDHCGNSEASVCIKSENGKAENAGDPSFALWNDGADGEDQGVTVIYANGDLCGSDNSRRKTVVDLRCYLPGETDLRNKRDVDPTSTRSYISFVSQDGCTTRMTVLTPFACPTNKHYESVCHDQKTRDSCFRLNTEENCQCHWCDSKCIASFEECSGDREVQCIVRAHLHSSAIFVITVAALLLFIVCFCICCCVFLRRRKLRSQLDSKLKLPQRHPTNGDFAMEPLMGTPGEQPWMYVQYPMQNGQANPPLFAPTPYFVVPQYLQPQE